MSSSLVSFFFLRLMVEVLDIIKLVCIIHMAKGFANQYGWYILFVSCNSCEGVFLAL